MNLLRPRYMAAASGAYFAIVIYLAWDTARQTTGVWYDPPMSQTVYQTSLVAGILVIAGLMVVASMHPRVVLPASARSRRAQRRALRQSLADASVMPGAPGNGTLGSDNASWERLERFLDDLSKAPQRSGRTATSSTADSDEDGVLVVEPVPSPRGPSAAATVESEESAPARPLAEYVNEIRALIVPARRAGLSGRQVWRLAGEPTAAPGNDAAERMRLAEHVKQTLESALDHRIREHLEEVLGEVQSVNAAAMRAHGAELAVAEAGTHLDLGNYGAAIDRAERASEMLGTRMASEESHSVNAGTSSWALLAGPALMAIAYVAASSMLLPGVGGFLVYHYVFNTTLVLVLSYGWVGLLVYALVSVYVTLSAATRGARGRSTARP